MGMFSAALIYDRRLYVRKRWAVTLQECPEIWTFVEILLHLNIISFSTTQPEWLYRRILAKFYLGYYWGNIYVYLLTDFVIL